MKISQVVVAVIVANLALPSLLHAQDRSYGRSVVSTPFGIVATSEVQASQAGARIGQSAIDSLTNKGHILEVRKEYTANMGRGNAVERNDATKINFAASDPRADGAAIPEFPADPAHTTPSRVHGNSRGGPR
jgi:gamma-glutamyltranspeptidase